MTTSAQRPTALPAASRETTTRMLLACGALAGPLFVATVLAQAATRAGFDPRRHPLSLLSLGDLGWIQITNFVACGVLALASAFGLRRVLHPGRAGTWGPALVGLYGAGLIWGGVFVADPAFGYPPGTPDGNPASMSWHGILHAVAPAVAGIAVVVACFVFARRYIAEGRRGWARGLVASGIISLALTWSSLFAADYRLMLAGGAVTWIALAAVAADQFRATGPRART